MKRKLPLLALCALLLAGCQTEEKAPIEPAAEEKEMPAEESERLKELATKYLVSVAP